jgi:NTP pyrophosphatase (non-canonical NTP hydrolase)
MEHSTRNRIIEGLSLCGINCHRISQEHGFWTPTAEQETIMAILEAEGSTESLKYYETQCKRNFGEALMLIVSEAAEALEVARKDFDKPAEHLDQKEFTHVEEELADIVIRVMDLAYGHNLSLGAAIVAKMEFNESRPYKHGKKF